MFLTPPHEEHVTDYLKAFASKDSGMAMLDSIKDNPYIYIYPIKPSIVVSIFFSIIPILPLYVYMTRGQYEEGFKRGCPALCDNSG